VLGFLLFVILVYGAPAGVGMCRGSTLTVSRAIRLQRAVAVIHYRLIVDPTGEQLVMYGQLSSARMLDWSWVRAQLETAGTYWVVARSSGHPHPRPVWGVWDANVLHLSIGSHIVASALDVDPLVTVHLGSDTDVVIVEGTVTGRGADAVVLQRYDDKYDWRYDVDEYGLLTAIAPVTVLAWRATGWAGRDGFKASGRWRFTATEERDDDQGDRR
jgi:hypothetical protein